jgi:hypothetical protein
MKRAGSDALLRKIALKLPEAEERPHFDMPSFRVGKKIFATARLNERKAMVKLPLHLQEIACAKHPSAVAPVPGAWGQKGATFVMIDKIEESDFADLVASAWAAVAPKRLIAKAKR